MIRNYLKTAWRNLWRHRSYSINSILSLAASLSVCLLLVLLLYDQWQYDRHHEHADRIYRVVSNPGSGEYASSPAPLGPALAERHSGVAAATRIETTSGHAVVDGSGIAYDGLYADPAFFTLFDRPIRAGSPSALAEPFQVFVSSDWAETVLGDSSPVGRALTLEGVGTVTIAGVMAEPKGPTHLPADVILSFATQVSTQKAMTASWEKGLYEFHNYVLLKPGTQPNDLKPVFSDLRATHYPDAESNAYTFRLQKVTDIALGPLLDNDPAVLRGGVLPGVAGYFLGGLMLLVLLAAGFTFTNLSLARALDRTKEVSVRKTMGARRWHVAGQFLVEAVLVAFVALAVALVLFSVLVPLFNRLFLAELLNLQLTFNPFRDPAVLLLFAGVTLVIGLVAGLYPAWTLSRPDPMDVLRGTGAFSGAAALGRSRLRRVLLAGQLILSVLLVVTSLLIYQQGRYLVQFDYGFDADRLVYVLPQDAPPDALRQEAQSLSGVTSTAFIGPHLPAGGSVLRPTFAVPGRSDSLSAMMYRGNARALLPTLGVKLVAGRQPGATGVLVNEEAVKRLGLDRPSDAVGLTLRGDTTYQISGVMENFQARPVFSPLTSVVLVHSEGQEGALLIRADPARHEAILDHFEERWVDLDPVHAFEGATYRETLQEITSVFGDLLGLVGGTTLFALLIAAMGLLGMAVYATQSRVREVGIRKALGARVEQIAGLLSKEFLVMSGVALAIGLPIGWLANRLWLDLFAHRIDVGVGVFIIAAAVVLTVTLGTAGVQALRTARITPAETLRDE